MVQKTLILAAETSSRVGSVAIAIGQRLLDEITFSGPMKHSSELFPAICNLLSRFEKKPQDIKQIYISVGPGSFTGLRIAVTLAKAMHLANSAKIVPVNTLDVIAANVTQMCHSERSEESLSHNQKSEIENHQSKIVNRKSSIARIAPILDAKRGQFYTAIYQRTNDKPQDFDEQLGPKPAAEGLSRVATSEGIWKKTFPDSLITADEFLKKFARSQKPIWLLGDGLVYHKDRFKADGIRFFDEEFWSPHASKVHQLGWKKALAGEFANPLTLTPNYLLRPDVTLRRK